MLAKLKTPNTIGKILLQNLMLMNLSTEPKPKEDTGPKMEDAPATKNSVQLAEEGLLKGEDAHQKAFEKSEGRLRRAIEKGKTQKRNERRLPETT